MNKKISLKKSLFVSALSIMLCLSMLVGTTFAWFTDSVVSANNIIKSGNLDVEMYWAEGDEVVPAEDSADWIDASVGAIFDYDNWEPGYVQVRHVRIANKGSLALKYKVSIAAEGEVSNLADVIDVYYLDPAAQIADRTALLEENKLGTLTEVLAGFDISGNGSLLANTSDTVTIALKMQESAGNEYQNKAIGTSFAVQLIATQFTYEEDSFDDQYDADANYPRPGYTGIKSQADFAAAVAAAQPGAELKLYLAEGFAVTEPLTLDKDLKVELDLNGKTISGDLAAVIQATEGDLVLKNGAIKNTGDAVKQRIGVRLAGNATAIITGVEIEVIGNGLKVEGNAKVEDLSAKIKAIFDYNGSYVYDAICVDGNGRIETISDGEYITMRSAEFIEAWYAMTNKSVSELASYTVNVISAGASIGEIKGGTFLGEMDKANNGTPIHVNAGTVEKISGGYFGFTKWTLSNPIRMLFVNTNNGASIGQIVGGTFEEGSLNNSRYGCDFAGIVDASGCQVVSTGETVEVKAQFSSSVKSYVLNVVEVVAK